MRKIAWKVLLAFCLSVSTVAFAQQTIDTINVTGARFFETELAAGGYQEGVSGKTGNITQTPGEQKEKTFVPEARMFMEEPEVASELQAAHSLAKRKGVQVGEYYAIIALGSRTVYFYKFGSGASERCFVCSL